MKINDKTTTSIMAFIKLKSFSTSSGKIKITFVQENCLMSHDVYTQLTICCPITYTS